MITETKRTKVFPIEVLKQAILQMLETVDDECQSVSKLKRANLEEAQENLIQAYAVLRGTLMIKPTIASWIPSRIPGKFPQAGDSKYEAPGIELSKPLLNSDDLTRRATK